MKITYTTASGRVSAEFEADSQKDLFSEINRFQEVFEEDTCGKCKSNEIKYVVSSMSPHMSDGETAMYRQRIEQLFDGLNQIKRAEKSSVSIILDDLVV